MHSPGYDAYLQRREKAKEFLRRHQQSPRFAHKRIVAELGARMQIPKAVKLHLAGLDEMKSAGYYRRHGQYDLCRICLNWSRRFRELSEGQGGFLPPLRSQS